jgi:hypothetical protein
MSDWSLPYLLNSLQTDIENRLDTARHAFHHSTTKGDATETVWVELLRKYLPHRYKIGRAHIVDSKGNFSQQIDLVIYDRQFTPPIFDFSGELILPAESVYAVFEIKQEINQKFIREAIKKFDSVRKLHRTAVPITNANTLKPQVPKIPFPILGGILALDNGWKTPWENHIVTALDNKHNKCLLNTGCVAACGWFTLTPENKYAIHNTKQATTAWLFNLITQLQDLGSVPAIDMPAYAKHFNPPADA